MISINKSKAILFGSITAVSIMVACNSPVITQTGNTGNNTSSNITGSTGSNVTNNTTETRENSGSGPKLNLGCVPNVNVVSPDSTQTAGDVNCTNTDNSVIGGKKKKPGDPSPSPSTSPSPSPSPSTSPSPSPSPSTSPSPSPSPSTTPTPIPIPTGPPAGIPGDVELFGTPIFYGRLVPFPQDPTYGNQNFALATDITTQSNRSYIGFAGNVQVYNDGPIASIVGDLTNGFNVAGPPIIGQRTSPGAEANSSQAENIRFNGLTGSDMMYGTSSSTTFGVHVTGGSPLLVYADKNNRAVRIVDPDGGLSDLTSVIPPLDLGSSGTLINHLSSNLPGDVTLTEITDVAVDPQNITTVYVVDHGEEAIYKLDLSTNPYSIERFAGLSHPAGEFDFIGSNTPIDKLSAKFNGIFAIAVNPVNGHVFVTERAAIREINPSNGEVTFYAGGRNQPAGLAETYREATTSAQGTLIDTDCSPSGSTFAPRISDIKIDSDENIFLLETNLTNEAWVRRIGTGCSTVSTLQTTGASTVTFQPNDANPVYAIFSPVIGAHFPTAGELAIDKDGNLRAVRVSSPGSSFPSDTSGRIVKFSF